MIAVRTQGLTKRFRRLVAVNGLDLEIPQGTVFGLLGPNGAGKTTTFGMLCGFIRPTSGSAQVLGVDLKDLDSVHGRIAALPQDARLHPDRPVDDTLIHLAILGGMNRHDARREVDRVLNAVGMTESGKLKGKELSHGMAKRLGVAQAFMGNPELVLLDEPTEGLDPRAAHTVRQMIRDLAGPKTTLLISSHNLAEIQDICDHVAIINHGKLVKSGSISEIVQADEILILSLGPGSSDPQTALSGLSMVKAVKNDGNRVLVVFKPIPGQPVEQAISTILQTALANGVLVGTVTRGHSLEDRYLELTQQGDNN